MTTGAVKDSRFDSVTVANGAPHNKLIFLETRLEGAELNVSSRSSDASSRNRPAQVEFVNHPEAVWLRRYAKGQRVSA